MKNRIEPLADGIYLGLSSDAYHADSALGSSNIRDLLKGANVYWHRSPLNPKQKKQIEEDSTKATVYGTAMHCYLLESAATFKEVYVRRPDDDDDATPAEKGATTKAAKAKMRAHQILLHGDEFDQIRDSIEIINRDDNLRGSIEGGLSEVSVFWTRKDGTRLKCRFDKLKLNAFCDLKTIANEKQRELGQACGDAIIYRGYEIQIAHYSEGRRALVKLVDKGLINIVTTPVADLLKADQSPQGRTEIDYAVKLLNKIAAEEEFTPTILFLPKPTSGSPDPLLFTFELASADMKKARSDIETALMIYRDALKKHGTEERWQPNMPTIRRWDRSEAAYGASRWVA
jgi:hypothetical protein